MQSGSVAISAGMVRCCLCLCLDSHARVSAEHAALRHGLHAAMLSHCDKFVKCHLRQHRGP